MAKYDPNDARHYLSELEKVVQRDVEILKNGNVSEEVREYGLKVSNEAKQALAFEYGFDNGDI